MTRDYRRRPAVGCLGPVSFRKEGTGLFLYIQTATGRKLPHETI